MALYPLSRHSKSQRGAISHAAGVIAERVEDVATRGDLLTTLGIFGKLANPNLDVFSLIGREQMKESKFYQEIMEEGREEGRLENSRSNIIAVLEDRFGSSAAAKFRKRLEGIADPHQLTELLLLAACCQSFTEFRRSFVASLETH